MNISLSSEPMAGKSLEIKVSTVEGSTEIGIYIGTDKLLDWTCDDPPCHQLIFIPRHAGNERLRVIARKNKSIIEIQEFNISPPAASARY